jgi:hypothetical protein
MWVNIEDVFIFNCISQFSIAVTKYLRRISLKEERFMLIQSLRGFSPWLLGFVTLGLGGSAW